MWYAKILLIIATLGVSVIDTSVAAPARRSTRNSATTQQSVPSTPARSAVSARSARSATPVATTTGGTRTMSARSATPAKTTPTVTARAATTQSPINNGTKVNAATKTTANSECQKLYNACMDSFCVIDNVDGGRCVCIDKFKTFEKLHNEINDINLQAYKLTTLGVEKIHATISKNTALDIDSMQTASKTDLTSALDMWGNTLRTTAHDACVAQIPQCANNLQMMSMMYSGTINSDCIGYENSLKNLRANAKQQLQLAEGNLREIALDSAKNANKYDLGQCTIKFRECMQTTAGCGEDFTGCVDIVNQNKARILNNQTEQLFKIPNTTANLSIAKSMYDVLQSKAPMCQSVLNQCVKVKDQVFNAFLRESYPELKIAQDTAEYNVRTDCISNVSKCFQKACKDNIDPNDPDGSYDACLMRPEMVLTFCKPELDLCGVNTKDAKTAKQSLIWDYVLAVLASMKVDACTVELKDCLANENRCGPDYSNCVGLSTDTIIRMCPYDKLMGCQNVYAKDLKEDFVYDNISQTVQGIILNIDNKLLNYCQAAVDAAATRACGDDLSCPGFFNLDTVGTTSLDYKICQLEIANEIAKITDVCYTDISLIPEEHLGRIPGSTSDDIGNIIPHVAIIEPLIYWNEINIDIDGDIDGIDDYITSLTEAGIELTELQRERLEGELFTLRDNMQHVFDAIEQDPTVEYCMNGRRLDGVELKRTARFPNITKSMRIKLANLMLQKAKNNYYDKYEELTKKMLTDYTEMTEQIAKIRNENAKDARREIARLSCVNYAEMSALPRQERSASARLREFNNSIWSAAGAIAVGAGISAATIPATWVAGMVAAIVMAGTAIILSIIGGIGEAVYNSGLDYKNVSETSIKQDFSGYYKIIEHNHKEDITTVFDPTNLTCEKCVITTHCKKVRKDGTTNAECKEWDEPLPKKCTTIEF